MKIRMDIRKIPLFTAIILLLLVGFTSATATAPVTTTTVQTLAGAIFKITGAFTVIAAGYAPQGATSSTGTNPCTWVSNAPPGPSPAGVCTTATVTGNWALEVNMQLNSGFVAGTYTILESVVGISGIPMSFSVPSTATPGSVLSFVFDLATTTLPATTVITVIVS